MMCEHWNFFHYNNFYFYLFALHQWGKWLIVMKLSHCTHGSRIWGEMCLILYCYYIWILFRSISRHSNTFAIRQIPFINIYFWVVQQTNTTMIAVLHNLNLCLMTEISRIFFVIVIRKCLIVIKMCWQSNVISCLFPLTLWWNMT